MELPMSWYPELGTETMVAVGDHVRAVGWLCSDHPFTRGSVPAEFLARLREFVRLAGDSAKALYFPAFGGFHTCELCGEFHDIRNLGVPAGEVLYVAPGMVAHYIEQHGYAPPADFVDAVMASPLPATAEFRATAKPFYDRHCLWWEAFFARQRAETEPDAGPATGQR
jgi:hypothetical protein